MHLEPTTISVRYYLSTGVGITGQFMIRYDMQYVALDNITIQQFCDNRYTGRQLYNDTSQYLTEEYIHYMHE